MIYVFPRFICIFAMLRFFLVYQAEILIVIINDYIKIYCMLKAHVGMLFYIHISMYTSTHVFKHMICVVRKFWFMSDVYNCYYFSSNYIKCSYHILTVVPRYYLLFSFTINKCTNP